MTAPVEPRAVASRIETVAAELAALPAGAARERAEELVRLVIELYGVGLSRIVEIVSAQGGRPVLERLAGDELVASLLLLHGLHPVETETRVRNALERVRPYLGSHGGGVSLVSVHDGVVRLKLEGTCGDCPSSEVTKRLAIERAVEEAAPEVVSIVFEGGRASTLPVLGAARSSWVTFEPARLAREETTAVELDGAALIVCRVGESLYAYRDACPSCGAGLAGAALSGDLLSCPACAHRYDVRRAGRCPDDDLHLDPLPLLAEAGAVRIAVPSAVR